MEYRDMKIKELKELMSEDLDYCSKQDIIVGKV